MTIFGLTLEQWANFKFYIGLAKPLLLFVYLPIALAGLLFLVTRRLPWHKKAPALLAYLVIAYAVPLGDVMVNSINMAKMCGKVGLHINRTVEVDVFSGYSKEENMHRVCGWNITLSRCAADYPIRPPEHERQYSCLIEGWV